MTTLLVAALAIALSIPLRGVASRLLSRTRDEDTRLLAITRELDERLALAGRPDDVVSAFAAALRAALDLSYVAVFFRDGAGLVEAHASGAPSASVTDVPAGDNVLVRAGADAPLDRERVTVITAAAAVATNALDAARLARRLEREQARVDAARLEDRQRLGNDLHDRIGPSLAALKISLSTHRRAIGVAPELLAAQAREVTAEVQAVLRGDPAREPVAVGLLTALERLSGRLAADGGLDIVVRSPGIDPILDDDVASAAYVIVAEALHNVVRHAGAEHCAVTLAHEPGSLVVTVEDDGVGLGDDEADGDGIGLRSLRDRARRAGGHAEAVGAAGAGTTVRVRLPRRG